MKERILNYTIPKNPDIELLPKMYIKFLYDRVCVGFEKGDKAYFKEELYYKTWRFEKRLQKLIVKVMNGEIK